MVLGDQTVNVIARKHSLILLRASMVLACVLWLVLISLYATIRQPEFKVDSAVTNGLEYRLISPRGNRTDAAVGVPGDPKVAYVGSSSGGIFKTIDGGTRWSPIFDKQDVQSIGSLAIDPSNINTIWAGTGEAFYIRNTTSIGDGIYKSTDAGTTWSRMGLEDSGRIPRIVVDPTNSNTVFAAVVGSGFAPSQDRGVYRTKDGGKTWQRVLFVNEDTGAADIAMDVHNPKILLAGMWQLSIHTWNLTSGGPSSGLYISKDGGDTWNQVTGHGLPDGPLGKSSVAICPSDSKRMYFLVQGPEHPGFYRSDDGGDNWKLVNQGNEIDERPPYYTRFTVDPNDANRIYFITVTLTLSTDGGATDRPVQAGGDNHDLWIDPKDSKRILLANDGGLVMTSDARRWTDVNFPNGQFYHVEADDSIPYNLYANLQDDFSWRIPSSTESGGYDETVMSRVGGCESGFTVPDRVTNDIVYSGCYDGGVDRFDVHNMQTREVKVWPISGFGVPPKDMKYRWNWTHPIAISPNDHRIVYVGSQYVHETRNGGQTWQTISPDLTRNDISHEQSSGGVEPDDGSGTISYDNLFTFDGATLWSIAESPKARGLIWVGSNDGLIHVTRNGGRSWEDVTPNVPGLPHWATIANIEPSHFDAATAYIAADDHMQGDNAPLIYKTADYGKSWRLISSGIPSSVFSYVACVKEDTVRPGLLFAATQNGVYFTLDDGLNWQPLQANMPHAPASWIDIQPRFGDLLVSTYGRGIYAMDDLSPLRQLTPSIVASDAYLFAPRAAYRFRREQGVMNGGGFRTGSVMEDAPSGAIINYYLKDKPLPNTEVDITILDPRGSVVHTMKGSTRQGINRVNWEFNYDFAHQPLLLTKPVDASYIKVPKNGRRLRTYDLDFSYGPPDVVPGTYTVRLQMGVKVMEQPLVVLKDPHSTGSLADIHAQVTMSLGVRDLMNEMATMIAQIESVRHQVELLPASEACNAFGDKALALEGKMFDVRLTGVREDQFRHPMQLWEQLGTFNKELTVMGADFRPTDAQAAVYKLLADGVAATKKNCDSLFGADLAALNAALKAAGQKAVTVPAENDITFAPARRFFGAGDESAEDKGG